MSGYTVSAGLFYDRLKRFNTLDLRCDHSIFLTVPVDTLINKIKVLKPFRSPISWGSSLIRSIFTFLNSFKLNRLKTFISYEYIEVLDQETWEFVSPRLGQGLTHKTKASFNWQINTPQYYDPLSPQKSRHVKILVKKELVGFISFIEIGRQFRVLCCVAQNTETMQFCTTALIDHFMNSKLERICTYDTTLANQLQTQVLTSLYLLKTGVKAIKHKSINLDHKFKIKDYEGA